DLTSSNSSDASGGNSSGGQTNLGTMLLQPGTYRFTSRKGIKSEPKIYSTDIAYYDSGDTVNYDKTLVADNHEWISYVSYSGARRYIAINQLAK
uniref:SH3 domain-containing protein n=1 Tax=Streptococcus suis TaxID=1307 RepID=UPI001863C88B